MEDAARQLAQRIAGALPPYVPAFLAVQNASSLSDAQTSNVRGALQAALEKAGFKFSADGHSQGQIRVTLSESLAGYLWVAEVRRGDATAQIMLTVPRPLAYGLADHSDKLVLHKDLIWKQETQIVDIKFLDDVDSKRQRVAILEPEKLVVYEQGESGWKALNSAFFQRENPWPRDLRGQIAGFDEKEGDAIVALLPRFNCQVLLKNIPDVSKFRCTTVDVAKETGWKPAWFLFEGSFLVDNLAEYMESRNFFTGQLAGEMGWRGKVEPFYSAAALGLNGREPGNFMVSAGLDGHGHLYASGPKAISSFVGWGSEITTVLSDCDTAWRVLVSGTKDWTQGDTITAYGVSEQGAVAVVKQLDFPGPVIGLGPEQLAFGESKGRRKGALAIIRNLENGNYEAYRITLSCGG